VPGIAVSLDAPERSRGTLKFEKAAKVAAQLVRQAMERGLPQGVLLNINIPYTPDGWPKGVMVTHQGKRIYRDELVSRKDPHGRLYYWIGGEPPTGIPEDGTDIGALAAEYVSLTPLHLDLTAHRVREELEQVKWTLEDV
jgi:5'-nucleotidase